jgi:flagellar biosynthesis protein FlhB
MKKGQLPISKWFMGLFLLFIVVVTYEFMGPIIQTTLPTAFASQLTDSQEGIVSSTNTNFIYGMMALGAAYLFYIFIGGLPGQQEQNPL